MEEPKKRTKKRKAKTGRRKSQSRRLSNPHLNLHLTSGSSEEKPRKRNPRPALSLLPNKLRNHKARMAERGYQQEQAIFLVLAQLIRPSLTAGERADHRLVKRTRCLQALVFLIAREKVSTAEIRPGKKVEYLISSRSRLSGIILLMVTKPREKGYLDRVNRPTQPRRLNRHWHHPQLRIQPLGLLRTQHKMRKRKRQ